MSKKYAYSPCRYARRYDKTHIRCVYDKGLRRVDKKRGCNSCNPRRCNRFFPKLIVRIKALWNERGNTFEV